MSITSFISLVIGFVGAIIAFATLWSSSKKNTKEETKESVETHAELQSQLNVLSNTIAPRLNTIDDGIRDLKAENRNTRSEMVALRDSIHDELREINDKATHALDLAEAAHRRLDRAGIDQDTNGKKEGHNES